MQIAETIVDIIRERKAAGDFKRNLFPKPLALESLKEIK